jgi:hypothetical protein
LHNCCRDLLLTAFFAEFGRDDNVLLLLRTSPERDGAALDDFIAVFRCEELTEQPPCRREALMQKRLAHAPRDGDGNPLVDASGRPLYSDYDEGASFPCFTEWECNARLTQWRC